MPKILPDDLFTFSLVAREGNLTKASKLMGISVSVLSKRLKRLEASVGVNLIQRTTRQLRLTDKGKECYEEIAQLKNYFENIIQKLKSHQITPEGKLRLSIPYSFGQIAAPFILEFMEIYPVIKIEMILQPSTIKLLEKNIDLAIFIKDIADSSLIAKKIGMRKIIVCASPLYLKKFGTPQSPQDLISHNCLLHSETKLKTEWRFQKQAVKIKGNFSANSSQVLMNAAIQGKGIVKLPDYVVKQALHEKKLISLLDTYCPKNIGIYAAYPYTRYPLPAVKALIEFLSQRFKEAGLHHQISLR